MLKGFADEFKKFIFRGNVVDLAVGVVIGAAFAKIIDAIVKGLFMPIMNALGSETDPGLKLKVTDRLVFNLGMVITEVINFVIIGFCLFLVVKAMNVVMAKKPAAPPEPSSQEKLLMEIRDVLKEKK